MGLESTKLPLFEPLSEWTGRWDGCLVTPLSPQPLPGTRAVFPAPLQWNRFNWRPRSAVWNACWEQTDPLGIAHPKISVGPRLLSFASTSSLEKRGVFTALWLFAGSLHFRLLSMLG